MTSLKIHAFRHSDVDESTEDVEHLLDSARAIIQRHKQNLPVSVQEFGVIVRVMRLKKEQLLTPNATSTQSDATALRDAIVRQANIGNPERLQQFEIRQQIAYLVEAQDIAEQPAVSRVRQVSPAKQEAYQIQLDNAAAIKAITEHTDAQEVNEQESA